MSFVDQLQVARSSQAAVLHTFLTSYDPNEPRVYAFVEADPDRAFYREHIERYLNDTRRLYVYPCGNKSKVFELYRQVTRRFPDCRNVLFFVDKDIDDLVGRIWPNDPRIFVTDLYSIENYIVVSPAVERYFADFVKLRRVTIDVTPALAQFESRLANFHRAIKPLMCWIIAARRLGEHVVLSDFKLDRLYTFDGTHTRRIRDEKAATLLNRVTDAPGCSWRLASHVRRELAHQSPKRYTRGKFEAWFLIEFVKRLLADLSCLAAAEAGNVSVSTPLHESNFVQVLVRAVPTPPQLEAFLRFHLGKPIPPPPQLLQNRLPAGSLGLLSRIFRLLGVGKEKNRRRDADATKG